MPKTSLFPGPSISGCTGPGRTVLRRCTATGSFRRSNKGRLHGECIRSGSEYAPSSRACYSTGTPRGYPPQEQHIQEDRTVSSHWFKFVPHGTECVHADRCSPDRGDLDRQTSVRPESRHDVYFSSPGGTTPPGSSPSPLQRPVTDVHALEPAADVGVVDERVPAQA